jgi:hypothetical protein
MNRSFSLKASVGKGGKNYPEDVKKAGLMLLKLGYIKESEIENIDKLSEAIQNFQNTELAPVTEKWYKKRIKVIEDAGKSNPSATKKSLEDLEIQRKNLTDGVVSKNGTTLNILYFLAEMGGTIPDLMLIQNYDNTKPKTIIPNTNSQTKRGIIQKGETIDKLSDKYGVNTQDLISANKTVVKEKNGKSYFESGIKLNMPEIVTSRLAKSRGGFSIGLPDGTYKEDMINFTQDVLEIQAKLREVGLLSETDYQKEQPTKNIELEEIHLPSTRSVSEMFDKKQTDQNIITDTPKEEKKEELYSYKTSEYERRMLLMYGKIPSFSKDKVTSKDIPKTIEAIKIFQLEINRKGVDGRIDPDGSTLQKLMSSTKESVTKARQEYALEQKRKLEEIKRRLQIEQEQQKIKEQTKIADDIWIEIKKHGLEAFNYLFEGLGLGKQYEMLRNLIKYLTPKTNIEGKVKREPLDFSVEGIKSVIASKGYEFYEEEGKLNLIAVRMSDSFDNKFSDKLFAIQKTKNGNTFLEIPWNAKASVYGHGGVKDPLTKLETKSPADGVAVIVEGQYKDVYQFVNSYKDFLNYPHLEQVKAMNYYRDNDKDMTIDRETIYKDDYDTHLHIMSNPGYKMDNLGIGGMAWSQGCHGAAEPEFKKLLPLFETHTKYKHGNIGYTLLHKNDFL